MEHAKITELDTLSNKMNVQLYVLVAFVKHSIGGHIHSGDVVAIGDGRIGDAALELIK